MRRESGTPSGSHGAIEAQRAIASAVWDAYHAELEVERALLHCEFDRVRRRTIRAAHARRDGETGAGAGSDVSASQTDEGLFVEEYERPRHASQGARYLGVALVAQREVARLQGLYERLNVDTPEVRITLSRRPDDAANLPPLGTNDKGADDPDKGDD